MAAIIDRVRIFSAGAWEAWNSSIVFDDIELGPKDGVLYRIKTNVGSSSTITGLSIVTPCSAQTLIYYRATLYGSDLSLYPTTSEIGRVSSSGSSPKKSFAFSDLSLTEKEYLYVYILNNNSSENSYCTIRAESVSVDYTLPPLTITGVSPSTVIGGNQATVNFGGRDGETLSLVLTANGTQLLSKTGISSDSTTVTTSSSWIDSYGSNDSLTVTATVSDTHGRSDSSNFTVRKAKAITPSIAAPKSGTYEGGNQILFGWSSSGGDGTASSFTLEYSTDNINWQSLASVSGSTTQWTASSAKFAPGTVYWRIKCRSSYGVDSNWVSASFTVKYSATSYVAPLNSPTGGNVNANAPITFAGTLRSDGVPYEPFTMASATFYWRARATDAYTQVSMTLDGANASITIAGGTFPTGSVSWYIEATDNAGTTTQTDVYTISTLASAIDAQPVSPVNTVEISNDEITFTWKFASTSGDPQNGAELQYSLDGSTWSQLASVTGTITSYVAPADTFHAGTVYWRVRAFNSVGDAGEWSTVAQFVAYGAPEAPSVTVDAVPFATVRWQGVGQVSYEVEVDGTAYGPFLGEEKAYALYDFLADGSHTARVRILGDAGVWSLWGETFFDIQNVPESSLTLRAEAGVDAELTWSIGAENFYVYRDGKLIARTNEHGFTDKTVLGEHEYLVIERLASGNYNASEAVSATSSVSYQHIAALAGGDWIEIPHTLKSQSEPSYSESQEVEYTYLSGDYPVASIGNYRTDTGSYSAVFLYTEEEAHKRFADLRGKPVILKAADGVVMIGILNAWERTPRMSRAKLYYTAYTFTLRRIDWEDYIDVTV